MKSTQLITWCKNQLTEFSCDLFQFLRLLLRILPWTDASHFIQTPKSNYSVHRYRIAAAYFAIARRRLPKPVTGNYVGFQITPNALRMKLKD